MIGTNIKVSLYIVLDLYPHLIIKLIKYIQKIPLTRNKKSFYFLIAHTFAHTILTAIGDRLIMLDIHLEIVILSTVLGLKLHNPRAHPTATTLLVSLLTIHHTTSTI